MTNGDNCQDGRFGQPADALFQAPVLYNLFHPMEGQERNKLGRFPLSKIQEYAMSPLSSETSCGNV